MPYQEYFNVLGITSPVTMSIFLLLALWSLVWKGIALWTAARNGSKPWFIAMLVINTVGILEIVYVFFFSKKGQKTAV